MKTDNLESERLHLCKLKSKYINYNNRIDCDLYLELWSWSLRRGLKESEMSKGKLYRVNKLRNKKKENDKIIEIYENNIKELRNKILKLNKDFYKS